MRHTAKIESIGILAGGIAHDFNNLLTGILGNASLMEETLPESSSDRALLQEIIRAARSAADLTRQILTYSGKSPFLMQPIDLSAVALESRAFVKRFIPVLVEIIFDTAPDLPYIEADAGQMQQLIMNLVINAAESFGESVKGSIRVTTRVESIDKRSYVSLTVSDNGSGMDEATQKRIFDPFFTTKFAGRGLGLSAVHGILDGHKAILKVQSKPGEGTTFHISFPVSDRRPRHNPLAEKSYRKGAGTILVVDDEPVVRNFAQAALVHLGYRVLLAENGTECVKLFRNLHTEISLVLLDFTMPVMNGEETFENLRGISPEMPVILSSGLSHAITAERFRGKAVAGFLSKPYTGAQLSDAIASALQGEPALLPNEIN